jgi:hypothetical protein
MLIKLRLLQIFENLAVPENHAETKDFVQFLRRVSTPLIFVPTFAIAIVELNSKGPDSIHGFGSGDDLGE